MQQALCMCVLIVWQELCYVLGKEVKEEHYKLNFPPGMLKSGERGRSKWFTMIKTKDKCVEIHQVSLENRRKNSLFFVGTGEDYLKR